MIPVVVCPYHFRRREVEIGLGAAKIAQSLQWLHEEIELAPADSDLEAACAADAGVSRAVKAALSGHSRVLVLAGNCYTASGTLGGIGGERTGILWFDAHGDLNTPETSVTGYIDGMALAIAMGACHAQVRTAANLERPIAEERVLLAGTRDLDPREETRLKASAVRVAPSANWSLAFFRQEAERVRAASSDLYLHLDLDAVDPTLSPGVNFQTPGGLTPQQLLEAVAIVAEWPELRAAAITNYNPEHDPEGVTLRLALRLAAILGRSS